VLFRWAIWAPSSLVVFGFQYAYAAKGKQFGPFLRLKGFWSQGS
jgi:hypothetical protein